MVAMATNDDPLYLCQIVLLVDNGEWYLVIQTADPNRVHTLGRPR